MRGSHRRAVATRLFWGRGSVWSRPAYFLTGFKEKGKRSRASPSSLHGVSASAGPRTRECAGRSTLPSMAHRDSGLRNPTFAPLVTNDPSAPRSGGIGSSPRGPRPVHRPEPMEGTAKGRSAFPRVPVHHDRPSPKRCPTFPRKDPAPTGSGVGPIDWATDTHLHRNPRTTFAKFRQKCPEWRLEGSWGGSREGRAGRSEGRKAARTAFSGDLSSSLTHSVKAAAVDWTRRLREPPGARRPGSPPSPGPGSPGRPRRSSRPGCRPGSRCDGPSSRSSARRASRR